MTTYLIITIIALTVGFLIGQLSKVDILDLEKQTQEMEELTEQLTKVADDLDVSELTEMQINHHCDLMIEILSEVEKKNIKKLEQIVLEDLGNFYFEHSQDFERDMNSESIESLLKCLESKSQESDLFKKVIKYSPDQ